MNTQKTRTFGLLLVVWLYILLIAVAFAALFNNQWFPLRVLLILPIIFAGMKVSKMITHSD